MNTEHKVKCILKNEPTPEKAYEKIKEIAYFDYQTIKEAYEKYNTYGKRKISQMYLYIITHNREI